MELSATSFPDGELDVVYGLTTLNESKSKGGVATDLSGAMRTLRSQVNWALGPVGVENTVTERLTEHQNGRRRAPISEEMLL